VKKEAKMEWISVNDERPKIGQKVILFSNGVVQQDIYMYDQGDINDYEVSTFWSRDDLDECPILKDDDMWIPLPPPPSSSNSDYAKSCDDCIYGVDGCQHEPPCTTRTGKPYYKKRDFA